MRFPSLAFAFLLTSACVSASVIQYDGTYIPSDTPGPGETAFSWADFGNSKNLTADGFQMDTRPGTGQWFGNHATFNVVYNVWSLGSTSQGNYVKLQSKVSSNGEGWTMYLLDGANEAMFWFDANLTRYYTAGLESPYTVFMNNTNIHTFEFWMKNGISAYAIDGNVVYVGAAFTASTGKFLIIGDGSAYDTHGAGSMTVRSVTVYSGADFSSAPTMPNQVSTPEPASIAVAGLGLAALGFLRRRR